MKKRMILAGVLMLLGTVLVYSWVFAAPKYPIKWRADTFMSTTRPDYQNFAWFCDQVTERSNGRLVMTAYPGGALGFKPDTMLRILDKGAVELSLVAPGYFVGYEPTLAMGSIYGVFPTAGLSWAVREVSFPLKKKIYQEWNSVLLASGHIIGGHDTGIFSNVDAHSWDDLKGLKIRSAAGEQIYLLKHMGLSPQFMPLSEVYMAMKTGIIDGVLTAWSSAVAMSLWEVADYQTIIYPDCGSWTLELVASKKHWDKLPRELQEIVQECATEAMNKQTAMYFDRRNAGEMRKKLEAGGIAINHFSPEEEAKTVSISQAYIRKLVEEKGGNCALMYELWKPYLDLK